MKKYLPFIISFSILVVVVFLWDVIKLPYNQDNLILGEYSNKQFNPQNEIVRFIFLIVAPVLIYLFFYLMLNKQEIFSINPKNKDYFLFKEKDNETKKLNSYFFFFITLITIEFCSLDFKDFISITDTYHNGPFLVHSSNYLFKGEFFRSTFYDYGFVANNIGLLPNFFLGYYTIGSVILVKLIFIYLNKFFLILISKKIISYLTIEISSKKILFIIFTVFIITLPDYYDHNSYFSLRSSLFLLFIFLLGSSLCDSKYSNLKNFIVGNFSLISLLWWFDIGAYSNALIIFSMIYLLIHKELKKFLYLILGVLFSWTLFFLIMPIEEVKEFFYQLNFIYSTADYLLGIEYLKPFSDNSSRWTKALITIYLTGIMLVNFNFSKEYKINYKIKIFTTLMFIAGIFTFKSALMRSDSHHLKYSSGLYTIVFFLIFLIFMFNYINKNIKIQKFFKNKKIIFILSLVCPLFFILDFKNIKNIIYLKKNITTLVKAEDKFYLRKDFKLIINKYKILSSEDNCIQILTDDISLPYFLRKPTCTQFYNPSSQILNGITEEKFINQLSMSSPQIILYKSPNNILLNFPNMPNVLEYINKKYSFFENYKGYIFYKIKK